MVRPPTVAVATPSTGFARTVTVELLLMRSPSVWLVKSRPIFGHDRQCYGKTTLSGNPAILRGCGVRHPGGHWQFSTREPRRPREVGEKPTRSRHCTRLRLAR